MARLPARPQTRTGMSNFRPLLWVILVNRNALRSSSGTPPRYFQRTSGCISVAFFILRSTTISSPALFNASIWWWRSGYPRLVAGAAALPGFFFAVFEAIRRFSWFDLEVSWAYAGVRGNVPNVVEGLGLRICHAC